MTTEEYNRWKKEYIEADNRLIDKLIRIRTSMLKIRGVASIIRGCIKYVKWRTKVLKRDNYTCQTCGQKNRKINVDHYPLTFAKIMYDNNIKNLEQALRCKDLWDINNGRTLCEGCHHKNNSHHRRVK